jgi:hypothetical protein
MACVPSLGSRVRPVKMSVSGGLGLSVRECVADGVVGGVVDGVCYDWVQVRRDP